MSFVIGASKREVEILKPKSVVGPNVGPGSYYQPMLWNTKNSDKAPFGSNSRRKLHRPHVEMMQDMI